MTQIDESIKIVNNLIDNGYEPLTGDQLNAMSDLITEIERLRANEKVLVEALKSIASNTCCDKCHEASLVAQQALEKVKQNAKE